MVKSITKRFRNSTFFSKKNKKATDAPPQSTATPPSDAVVAAAEPTAADADAAADAGVDAAASPEVRSDVEDVVESMDDNDNDTNEDTREDAESIALDRSESVASVLTDARSDVEDSVTAAAAEDAAQHPDGGALAPVKEEDDSTNDHTNDNTTVDDYDGDDAKDREGGSEDGDANSAAGDTCTWGEGTMTNNGSGDEPTVLVSDETATVDNNQVCSPKHAVPAFCNFRQCFGN